MRSKTAVIVGAGGQDGRLLVESLESSGYETIKVTRNSMILKNNNPQKFSVTRFSDVYNLVDECRPNEIYYLAAHHSSSEKNVIKSIEDDFHLSYEVHVRGLYNFLEAVRMLSFQCNIFYAASSLIFDGTNGLYQNEETPFNPVGIYGLTKMFGVQMCRYFRESEELHVTVGIPYTHESVFRKSNFLSKKLISAAHKIHLGEINFVNIGSLEAKNDWGYAPDFVEAFQLITRHHEASDFIIATGEAHSVYEFATAIFARFNLEAIKYIKEDPSILNRSLPERIGDISKIKRETGWKPTYNFIDFASRLVDDYLLEYKNSEKN